MIIRDAKPSDAAALAEIYRPYVENTAITFEYVAPGAEEFEARLARVTAHYPWLVLEQAGEILGYAFADRAFEKAAYAWCADMTVYLAPQATGRGLGRLLYAALENRLRARGIQILYALVTASNVPSLLFHDAMGYREIGRLPESGWKLGAWQSVIWMEKRLAKENPTVP